ncbi:ABC transporter substrate-binding protein [Roseomonas haemaphysalidis]|uniref:ABC transporter substrate-binding protein n=1 Tax=Roseomonas haemaphysalidis TaxID=2768162 RepID=A0ABS3KKT8_9PROT|nr:ABC transporter substrate-binding protein [Roseomonas haemaphysalidis]MBO1078085.1 ABC transporter substrate-binding protein [Roseomonas haemaphysalidis]
MARLCKRLSAAALALLPLCWPLAAAAQGNQLLYLAEDVPAGLDYDGPSVSVNTSQTGFINMMDTLVDFPVAGENEEGIRRLDFSRFEGRLAESWSYDAASRTWTFKLRQGVKSCAGNVFTADDVIYTLARGKSVSGAAPINWFLGSLASIQGFDRSVFTGGSKELGDAVEKVDDHTIRIRQSTENNLFLTVMTVYSMAPFDSVEMRRHATPQDPWSHTYANTVNAAGFGPYCLERWVKDDEFVLRANPDYYRGRPNIDRVVIKRVPQSANRALTLRSGQAQLTQRLTAREFQGLARARGVKVAGIFGNETLVMGLNWRTPPFDNPKLRQALAFAMPYDQISRIGYAGAARQWEGHFTEVLSGYVRPDTQYPRDLARARALLAEAGYPEGRGLEAFPDAFRLSFTAERESYLGPIATAIQSALGDIGVRVQLDPMPQTQFADRRMVKKDLPMALSDTEKPVGPDVVYATRLYFVSPAAGGVNNITNYDNPELDRLFTAAQTEPDPARRAPLLSQIQNLVQRDLAWLPLVETKTQWAFSDRLSGLTWHPDNSLRLFELTLAP